MRFNMSEPAVNLRLVHGDITTLDVPRFLLKW